MKRKITRTKTAAIGFQPTLVGFIDLLGFSQRVLEIRSAEALRATVDTLTHVRDSFDYRTQNPSTKASQRIIGKRVRAFSDCLVVSIPLQSRTVRLEGGFDFIGLEILEIAWSQCRCAAEGHFVRGVLEIGGWYNEHDVQVSPALVSAYRQERCEVSYPVIAVSDHLYKILRNHPDRRHYSKDIDPVRAEFSSFKHPKTNKRVHFVNYLRLTAVNIGWEFDQTTIRAHAAAYGDRDLRDKIRATGIRKNREALFAAHQKAVSQAYKAASKKDEAKYEFLARYHNRELRHFLGTKPSLRIDL